MPMPTDQNSACCVTFLSRSPRFHTCFGWFNFWDWFHKTDAEFERAPVHKERHVVLKDLRSARELVPDSKYE